ncbi:MAG: hypothetical protein ACTHQ3_15880 [Motilibacteraceae bacterium]
MTEWTEPGVLPEGVSWCAESMCWECGRMVKHKPFGGPQKRHGCRFRWLARRARRAHLEGWHSGYRWAVEHPDDPMTRADAEDYGTGMAGLMRVGHLDFTGIDKEESR